MYRADRPGLLLATVLTLFSVTSQAAIDPVIDAQDVVSASTPGATTLGRSKFDAVQPAVTTDTLGEHALVVWSADDAGTVIDDKDTADVTDDTHLVNDEFEIFGNIVDIGTQANVTGQFRISFMGSDDETSEADRQLHSASNPAVAWNPVTEEFLVVWQGDDSDTAPLADDEYEIFGQRIDSDGERVGKRFRISAMGAEAEGSAAERRRFGAFTPAVAADPVTGDYLVVWQGDDNVTVAASGDPVVDDEFEIYGRVIDADGDPADAQFRVSTVGDDAETLASERVRYGAAAPAIVYNATASNFVVVWEADDPLFGLADGEFEIFARAVASDGSMPDAAKRVSEMGPDGDAAFDAHAPALAVNADTGTQLVTWSGDTSADELVEGEAEIHGRLLDSGLVPAAPSFRISVMGPESETDSAERGKFQALHPGVEWSPKEQEFLVVWHGDTLTSRLVDDENEIHGRFVQADGSMSGSRFRISKQGDNKEDSAAERVKFSAEDAALTWGSGAFYVVWSADADTTGNGVNGEFRVEAIRVASTYGKLGITLTGLDEGMVVAPAPVNLRIEVTNSGEEVVEDAVLAL
ncbi:MAG TPA: hypothetical protein VF267_05130, partial [Gammaproteobacteria bacterium]